MDRNRTTYKLFSLVLAAAILLSVGTFFAQAQDSDVASGREYEEPIAFTCLMGDVDGNGDINAIDARLALRLAAKLDPGAPVSLGNADVITDGEITAEDAMQILRRSAKLSAEGC